MEAYLRLGAPGTRGRPDRRGRSSRSTSTGRRRLDGRTPRPSPRSDPRDRRQSRHGLAWHHRPMQTIAIGADPVIRVARPGQALRRPGRGRRHRLRGRAAARSSASSGRTAPARPRRSRSSRACARPTAARRRCSGSTSPTDADALKPRIGVSLQTAALYPKLTVIELIDLFRSFYATSRPTDRADRRARARRARATPGPASCRAASASASRSPSPWSTIPSWSSSTSRRPASTRPRAGRCGTSSATSRRKGRTVLLTTHYMEEAEVLCDRLAIMDHGRILEMGTVDELDLEAVPGARRPVRLARRPRRRRPRGAAGGDRGQARRRRESLLYTRDVAATIGALLALDRSARPRAPEPRDPPGDPRGRLPRPDRPGAA